MVHQPASLRCLDSVDHDALSRLLSRQRAADKGKLLVVEGSLNDRIFILTCGWGMRYKSLPDGRRQILNFLLPGDIEGFFGLLSRTAACGVEALTPVTLHNIRSDRLLDTMRQAPQLAFALSWLAGQAERRLDEQILRIGRRDATERMAHLFMELHYRLLQADIGPDDARRFPLTQTVLADALGMSHVHANRSFRVLAREGLVDLQDGNVLLLDTQALSLFAGFNPAYLKQQPLSPAVEPHFPAGDLHNVSA